MDSPHRAAESHHEVVIIGAGFSGIGMAIQLRKAGIDSFVILEKAGEVGGTWRDNTYPGCACDVQSHLYSYSFEGNPDWSRVYSGWEEIKAYIRHCADKHRLLPNIGFNREVKGARFDEQRGIWSVRTARGETFTANILVMASGPLHHPYTPEIPGLDRFKGKILHSARWDHSYSMQEKNIVSIGTGASAIQYLPHIAPKVKQISVFQRTPAWVLPRGDRSYCAEQRLLFKQFPLLRKLHRTRLYWSNEISMLAFWNPAIAKLVAARAKAHIRKQVTDPLLAARLTPNYTIGCKRVLISDDYYPTFNRANVELVTERPLEIREHSLVTEDGRERPADAIIFGTGFLADPREYLRDCPIVGLHGQTLMDAWQQGAEAYLGMTVSGFPNLFQMIGPNTGLGHSSVIFMIESQIHYILECIHHLRRHGLCYMDVKTEAQAHYNQRLQHRLNNTVWTAGCKSWYQQSDGRNFTIWPGTTFGYRARTRQVIHHHYQWTAAEPPATLDQEAASAP